MDGNQNLEEQNNNQSNENNSNNENKKNDDIAIVFPRIIVDSVEKQAKYNQFIEQASRLAFESLHINDQITDANLKLFIIKRRRALLEHKREVLG